MYKFNKASSNVFQQLLFDFYTTFDFFGQRPMLRIFKNRKYSTSLGFVLSLTLMIVCGIFMIVQFQTLALRTNPSTIITENLSIDTQPFPLLMTNFTLGMLLTYQNMTQISTLGTHWNMEVQNCHRAKLKDPLTNQTMVQQNCTKYPIDPCGPEHFITQTQKDYYSQAKLGYVYCFKADIWAENPPVLQGTVQAQTYQYLTIKVAECKNTTEKQNCASKEEIKKELQNGYFALQIEDNIVKMKNQQSPFQDMISLSYSSFSISSSKTIFQYLKITDSITDTGVFIEDLEEESKLVLSQMQESQDLYNDQFIILQYLMLDSRSISYFRSYPRIQDIIGKVGGLWSAIFVILHVMLKPLTFFLMNLTMANKLFRFEIEEIDEIKEDFIINKQPQQKSSDFHSQIQSPKTERGEKVSNLYLSVNQQRSKTEFEQIKDRNQIRQFLKKKKKSTQIGWKHLLLIMLGCNKKIQTQLDYANNKVKEKLDIAYILKKLYELEKLKFILFNEDQLSLFNYLPKPIIPYEMFSKDFEQKIVEFEKNKAYKFILQEEKSDIIKMQEAYISYSKLQQLPSKTQIDCSLLSILDTEIVDFFERLNNDQTKSDIVFQNSPVNLSRHQDLELIRSIRQY